MLYMRRIGIYGGTFDPVHTGHIAFALQAITAAQLDTVYFMPEREPRRKAHVEHYGHRYAMLQRAVRPHAQLAVLDTTDKHFSVLRTLPRLQQHFQGVELVLVMGSDVATYVPKWPHADMLVKNVSFCVGLRAGADRTAIEQTFVELGVPADRLVLVGSYAAQLTSSKIRDALRSHRRINGVLMSVYKYAQKEWLYL